MVRTDRDWRRERDWHRERRWRKFRERRALVCALIILLCIMIILAMLWALFVLFVDTQNIKSHLRGAEMVLTLERTELTKTTLNAEGKFEPSTSTEVVDFSGKTNENVFGLYEGEKIAPGTTFVAKMRIGNEGDVAFGYWIEIVCTDKSAGEALAKQLYITVNTGEDNAAFVADGLTVGSEENYVGEILVNGYTEFTVTVEFLDSFIADIEDNNLAQGEELSFDLIVHAVQAT